MKTKLQYETTIKIKNCNNCPLKNYDNYYGTSCNFYDDEPIDSGEKREKFCSVVEIVITTNKSKEVIK